MMTGADAARSVISWLATASAVASPLRTDGMHVAATNAITASGRNREAEDFPSMAISCGVGRLFGEPPRRRTWPAQKRRPNRTLEPQDEDEREPLHTAEEFLRQLGHFCFIFGRNTDSLFVKSAPN